MPAIDGHGNFIHSGSEWEANESMKPRQHAALSLGDDSRLRRRLVHVVVLLATSTLFYQTYLSDPPNNDLSRVITQCADIATPAGPGPSYNPDIRASTGSDRYVFGTAPTLIRNAKIWTGAANGTEIVNGDILLDKGVVVALGRISMDTVLKVKAMSALKTVDIVDAKGKWVTPGIVDLHSHIGLDSAPHLKGSADTNSRKAPILPWLRSIDALNTHDESYALAIAGGVTTAQILPGSANNIGGQSFLIKLRPTEERSAISKVLEPPQSLIANQTSNYPHWRHMKHACGENPSRVYSQTRMDSGWKFREAYESARKLKVAQDAFCAHVASVQQWSWWPGSSYRQITSLGEFPQDLQWEALVDVLRGRVKLSVHCYEAVDLDAIVRGGVPSIVLFASNARKKREAYRNSEFAPKVLADNGIPVVMKACTSDHPVLNSRYLLYEAQQAHYYGLDANLALASVTSTPARTAGVGHRVGTLAAGYDADVVIWDSHPLALGATPVQVYIDGIAQLKKPQALAKPEALQEAPITPNWDAEAQAAVEYEGLPPLRGRKVHWGWNVDEHAPSIKGGVKFVGVKSMWMQDVDGHVHAMFDEHDAFETEEGNSVVVRDGSFVLCTGENVSLCGDEDVLEVVDLQGGSLAPGLTTFGSPLGLVEILLEPSTSDGAINDPLTENVPAIAGGDDAIIRAVDGLQFEGRNTLLAYRSGVSRAISAPITNGFLAGLSATFDTGATNALETGAITQEETALHIAVSQSLGVSVSTQIATLRRLLYHSTSEVWQRVQTGAIPLVVDVDNADIMSSLLRIKSQYEAWSGNSIRLTFTGAAEAHLLAKEIGEAGVSVVITSPRPYPGEWQNRRILPGPPLSRHSTLTTLLAEGVNVAIGVRDDFDAHNARFNLAWAALDSSGTISKAKALQVATTHLDRALGANRVRDVVAYRGGSIFDFESRDEAYTSSVKLQRHSLDSANAHDRAVYLERENGVLLTELAVLRAHPHPDAAPQAHPAVAQVQQLTLSLRRLSDKLSLTETALLERTTELSHVTAEATKAKLIAEGAYELAARTRGREEAGKSRELELEWKVKVAEESAKMSDLVVKEYADLVRSLEAKQPREKNLIDGLAEGKLGLQRLLSECSAESARLQKELLEAQGALAVAESHRDSDKKFTEKCRVDLAQAQFELQQLKIDDNAAAKMVSRYMYVYFFIFTFNDAYSLSRKFSQKSTDTLSDALTSLKTRHAATTSTLSSQIMLLGSQLSASQSQAEALRRALDELGGELAKEAFGRRREVALRIRMVNREEKLRAELERWVLRAEEAREGVDVVKMVNRAREVLEGTLGGVDGAVGRLVVAEAAVRELTTELKAETARRLELEKLVALEVAKDAPLANGHAEGQDHGSVGMVEMASDASLSENTSITITVTPAAPLISLHSSLTEELEQPVISESSQPRIPETQSAIEIAVSPAIEPLPSSASTSVVASDRDTKSLPQSPPIPPIITGREEEVDTTEQALSPAPLKVNATSGQSHPEFSPASSPEVTPADPVGFAPVSASANGSAHHPTVDSHEAEPAQHAGIPQLDEEVTVAASSDASSTVKDSSHASLNFAPSGVEGGKDSPVANGHGASNRVEFDSKGELHDGLPALPFTGVELKADSKNPSSPTLNPTIPPSITVPSPTTFPLGIPKPPLHPLLAELAQTKHRYDNLQRSLRDCHLALEAISASISPGSVTVGRIPAEALRTAVQRLRDYTEDARVEVEIRIADEALAVRGFETLLSVPGALATVTPQAGDDDYDHDMMTHSDVEMEVKAFVNGADPSVNKAIRSISRKLEDIEHDISALKLATHDDSDKALGSPPPPSADTSIGSGWTSWIRSTPASPASPPASAPGPAPTFGSVMTSPRLRHSPSLNFSGRSAADPLSNLGLRVPMPSYIQAGPAAVQPRSRTLSTMYMLGLGARKSGPSLLTPSASPRKPSALGLRSNGTEFETEVSEDSDNDVE
ncbi:hypothetical protein H0H87_011682 [Tephrocybe sp. NHM501043]|nr:hypothetical protein H0H87_011682 [Tephrocybe sp. NHM501043]